jgi:hypothetical protein
MKKNQYHWELQNEFLHRLRNSSANEKLQKNWSSQMKNFRKNWSREMKFKPILSSLLPPISFFLIPLFSKSYRDKWNSGQEIDQWNSFSSLIYILFVKRIKYSCISFSLLQSHAWFIKAWDWGGMLEYRRIF